MRFAIPVARLLFLGHFMATPAIAIAEVIAGCITRSGSSVVLKLKTWCHADGFVHFELRRILQSFYGEQIKVSIKATLRQSQSYLQSFFERMGTSFDAEVTPSLQWCVFHDSRRKADVHVRDEWGVTTFGAISWLALWSAVRKTARDRERAEAILSALASKCTQEDFDWGALTNDAVARASDMGCRNLCGLPVCRCLGVASAAWLDGEVNACTRLARFLSVLAAHTACAGCMRAFVEVGGCLAKQMDEHCHYASRPYDIDLAKSLCSGGQKRQRIDSDFKEFMCVTAMQHKRHRTLGMGLKTLGFEITSTSHRWAQQWLCSYLLECRKRVLGASVVWLAEDDSRAGCLAEDYTIYALWDAASNVGAILPIQASLRSLLCV